MPILPDILEPGLKLVVCGTAAGRRSAELGAYYAGPGNQFWGMLYRVGATPRLLKPAEFPSVTLYKIGLTDIAKEASGADSSLASHHFDAAGLRARMLKYQPGVLVFNGKRAAAEYLGRSVQYLYQEGQDIGRTRIFVAPSTSGAARGFWDETIWRCVAEEAGVGNGDRNRDDVGDGGPGAAA